MARWLLPLLGFIVLGVLVRIGVLAPLDQALFETVRSPTPTPLDTLANVVTVIGQTDVDLAIGAALAVYFVFARHEGWIGWTPLLLLVVAIGVELAGKGFVGHLRPPREFMREETVLPTLLGLAKGVTVGPSFPSGHVLRTAVLALFVRGRWPALGLVGLAVTLAVAATRIILGVHWLSDVIGSAFAALFVVNAWDAAVRRFHGSRPREAGWTGQP